MEQAIVLQQLKQLRPRLQALGVRRAAVFGSVARGEQSPESDVDVLLDVRDDVGLLDIAALQAELQAEIAAAHVAIADQLKPTIRDRILSEAVYAF
jgi:hypothetical protein